ncbi:hypothetical protein K437DRAFT_256135 [Tilletiaria anomala UBC 951]|uniref:Uncharacterized protein n=1 Tax=Tilletiaria anomala (strain ATCC 24038 / CBS 436.72 / UBC 951) TaxID=1037660 RepID=A0A066W242_TILAU|nr:uncharacterized protein K437DRAFT_256135 [Tilletiaria anomala UBC 951]KDN46628.1 hypothetical protein K437DRAFT_256135 [Tilletiaria anomala UBC 951]
MTIKPISKHEEARNKSEQNAGKDDPVPSYTDAIATSSSSSPTEGAATGTAAQSYTIATPLGASGISSPLLSSRNATPPEPALLQGGVTGAAPNVPLIFVSSGLPSAAEPGAVQLTPESSREMDRQATVRARLRFVEAFAYAMLIYIIMGLLTGIVVDQATHEGRHRHRHGGKNKPHLPPHWPPRQGEDDSWSWQVIARSFQV